jgi:hypothetical protein
MAELVAYDTGDDSAAIEYGTEEVAQSITVTSYWDITSIEIKIYRVGSPGTCALTIYATDGNGHPTGASIRSLGIAEAAISTDPAGAWHTITVSGGQALTAGKYAFRLTGGNDASNYVAWRFDNNDATYAGGDRIHSTDGGTNWVNQSGDDLMFRINGTVTLTPPTDITTIRKLVAAGNNEIWYEDSAGSMTELTAANGDIDTTDQLMMFELLQKVFVVNGTNLKVADFINTKLSTADVRPNDVTNVAPMHGTILTGGTSGAKMVVDYCNANDGAGLIYGYNYNGIAFQNAEVVTGTNTSGTPTAVSFTTDAVPVSAPHWYDWAVYPTIGGVSYGTMPTKAYVGCNYRGRAKLSGNPLYPHQWYMSRQLNPWDWAYVANDAQSPVKGGDADAGEIGDIVRAVAPYRDDYCIHGCATSMWFMAGDPAEGGSINKLDLTVGIFGFNSWCFDGEGNFYFWGDNGLYVTSVPGKPRCISEQRLPKLVDDEAADPSTHRVTIAYDRTRVGILVCITKLSDGTNSNYWYDLQTKGFFPETYGANRGPYSLLFYAANATANRDLLVGCKDGYIRKFNESLKSDNDTADAAGAGTVAIDSYVGYGPLQINSDVRFQGKISGLDLITAGGATGGSESDSNNIACKVYVAKTAEEIVEKLDAGTTPNLLKTFKAPGRQRGNTIKQKLKGVYAGIELRNSTVAETWGFEQLLVDAKPAGKVR